VNENWNCYMGMGIENLHTTQHQLQTHSMMVSTTQFTAQFDAWSATRQQHPVEVRGKGFVIPIISHSRVATEALTTRVAQPTFFIKCGLGHSGSQRLNSFSHSRSRGPIFEKSYDELTKNL